MKTSTALRSHPHLQLLEPATRCVLPSAAESWPLPARRMSSCLERGGPEASLEQVKQYARDKPWVWPGRAVLFFCDVHADTDALLLSLEASGGVRRTGPSDRDFELTARGREALFVIGGDCFDKGPENLRLLRCLEHLLVVGADVRVLAGNHDLRTYLGIRYAGRRETRFQHLFVRMGKKTVPLFAEIHREMQRRGQGGRSSLSDAEVRARLFPDESWYDDFHREAQGIMSAKKLDKELRRIREKSSEMEAACAARGMSLGCLFDALSEARRAFVEPGGEFSWFFERMTLALRQGSFLFVHAGVDDALAQVICSGGVQAANDWYQRLFDTDLFELYHGPVGNAFRTKYRDIDFPLTQSGVSALRQAGIYAVVHGHRNLCRGQRITLRAGLLNFECDASVDRNTRIVEGLSGPGAAAVIFEPGGRLTAVSTDHPFVKSFDPAKVFSLTYFPVKRSPQHRRIGMKQTKSSKSPRVVKPKVAEVAEVAEEAAEQAAGVVAEAQASAESASGSLVDAGLEAAGELSAIEVPKVAAAAGQPEEATGVEATGGEEAEQTAEASEPERRVKDKGKIKFESLMQRKEAVAYFSALVDGLEHGHLQFKQKDETLELDPAEQVVVEVKASKKGGKQKVAFELAWRTDRQGELEVSG